MGIESVSNSGNSYQGSSYSTGSSMEAKEAAAVAEAVTSTQTPVNSRPTANFQTDGSDDENQKATVTEASDSSIKKAVEDINKKSTGAEAIFGYHEGTNRVTIKIVDKDTKEVKKEYPAEKTLDMIQKVWEMAGLMVDEKR